MGFKLPTAFDRKTKPLSEAKDTNPHTNQLSHTNNTDSRNQLTQTLDPSVPTAFNALSRLEEHSERVEMERRKEQAFWQLVYLSRMVEWVKKKQGETALSYQVCLAMWFDSKLERTMNSGARNTVRAELRMQSRAKLTNRINDNLYSRRGPRTRTQFAGARFGKLTGMHTIGHDHHGNIIVRFKCDCGREHDALLHNARTGRTTSCGNCEGDSVIPRSRLTLAAVFKDSLNNHLSAAKVTNHSCPPSSPKISGDSNDQE